MSGNSIVGIVSMLGGYTLAMFMCLGGPALLGRWVQRGMRVLRNKVWKAARRHKDRRPASSLVVRDALFSALLRQNYTPSLKATLVEPSLFDRVAPNNRYAGLRIHSDYLVERAKASEREYIKSRLREDMERPAWGQGGSGNDVPELHKQLYARREAGVIKVLPDEVTTNEAAAPTL